MTDRPVGDPVDWTPVAAPGRIELHGRHVTLRPLDPAADAEPLHRQSHPPLADPAMWTYMGYGPFPDPAAYERLLAEFAVCADPVFFTLIPQTLGQPAGIASYLRITPDHGVIEIGHLWFGAQLRRTTAASEAIYLLAEHVFDELGYRRLEWKCDALNQASRAAAMRFGFRFEGVFAQHMVVKGRNRDTAWYAITDKEWPAVRAGFTAWLADPAAGRLGESIAAAREA